MNFDSRFLVQGLSERDEISMLDRRGLVELVNFGPGVFLVCKNTQGCKKFCNTFLVHGLADGNEIWHGWGIAAEQVFSYFGELFGSTDF